MRDTHPVDALRLKRYWTVGEGRAKWDTWRELRDHLAQFMDIDKAKRTAAQWFHDVKGYWPGADLNRVAHGKPPRGKVIGPG